MIRSVAVFVRISAPAEFVTRADAVSAVARHPAGTKYRSATLR